MLVAGNMREYFREVMTDAIKRHGVALTEHAQVYVVHLMTEFSRTENVFAGADPGEKPALALLLSRAQECERDEALRIYKHMGDSSLILSGYFRESVEGELVSRDYYASMGESAYSSVAALSRGAGTVSAPLFDELAARFRDLMDLLEAMSLHGAARPDAKVSDQRLVELIARYQRTGSKEVLDALKAHGVVLRPGLGDDADDVH